MIEETEELTEELLLRGVKGFLCDTVTQKFIMLIRKINTKINKAIKTEIKTGIKTEKLKDVSVDDIKDIFELDNIYTNNCGLYGREEERKEYTI